MEQIETIRAILRSPVPVSLVTVGPEGSHLIGVWNTEVVIPDDATLVFPAGGMKKTEENIERGSDVKLLIASRDVPGAAHTGAGFRITGTAAFHYSGSHFERMKADFAWARAALVVTIRKIDQLI